MHYAQKLEIQRLSLRSTEYARTLLPRRKTHTYMIHDATGYDKGKAL